MRNFRYDDSFIERMAAKKRIKAEKRKNQKKEGN